MSADTYPKPLDIQLYQNDLPAGISFGDTIAVDTETQGLSLIRDRLCVVQISSGDGVCYLVQFTGNNFDAPNLKALMTDPNVTKVFHYARFDVAMMKQCLDITINPIYCTKIASKLIRTYTDRHGLKDVTRELLGIELSKQQQSSDWAAETLSQDQLVYAAGDVLNLLQIKHKLDVMLAREGRTELAKACFDFLGTRGDLDLMGWSEVDIFSHA